jgi:hypothetical protein
MNECRAREGVEKAKTGDAVVKRVYAHARTNRPEVMTATTAVVL